MSRALIARLDVVVHHYEADVVTEVAEAPAARRSDARCAPRSRCSLRCLHRL
ncbi:hypothetical protein BN903_62 [Halorubrum sp. AJ67]|nr:hypothetical protein BN903_62 [Halorubrum sp. AJ67]